MASRSLPAASARRDADVELVEAAQSGDRAAFAQLYERFGAVVHGVLVSMVAREDAADLTQEVFLSALRMLPTLEQPERFGGWLCTIARNRARDLYKRPADFVELGPETEPVEQDPAHEDEEAAQILSVLQTLPEAYRETLSLRLVEGLNGPDIAHRTGMTAGSVRVNLHRGLQLLRERLNQRGLGGGAS